MKHAYLIEAHSKFEQLILLLRILDYPNNDVYIHIDEKAIIPEYIKDYVPIYSKVVLLEKRYNVQWGSFSQIEVECALLREALNNGKYDYLHLISGVDFPIKSQKDIHEFFKKNNNKEFVHIDAKQDSKEIRKRVSKYFLFIDKYGRSSKLLNIIQNIFVTLQIIIGIDRTKKENKTFFKGSNWFSITGVFAKYVINNYDWIVKHFKKTKCCDEVFLQTLLMNSNFKNHLYYDEIEEKYSNLRLIDWKRGNPYIFREKDFDELITSRNLFARKFDIDIDAEILNKLSRLGEK